MKIEIFTKDRYCEMAVTNGDGHVEEIRRTVLAMFRAITGGESVDIMDAVESIYSGDRHDKTIEDESERYKMEARWITDTLYLKLYYYGEHND